MFKGAIFSKDMKYRYKLTRIWEEEKGVVAFVGLNPSTADEKIDDPTVRRCVNYAKSWGYGGMIMLNLFAYRSKFPRYLYDVSDPVGPDNDAYIYDETRHAKLTVAAWGVHGSLMGRWKEVLKLIDEPHCLARTKGGMPKHPLYLSKKLKPKLLFN